MLLFENFNEIHKICKEYGIINYTINTDSTIDVDGNVKLYYKKLTELPVKFRNVVGNFSCGVNKLTTLEGAPKSVGGNFLCHYNKLTTLEGAPQSVSGSFDCDNNELTTLEGAPKSVSGSFFCYGNRFDVIRIMFPNDTEFFNANKEWDFFAGGNKIRMLRFKEALLDYDKELPESISVYEYI
jgi:hypothetical protein